MPTLLASLLSMRFFFDNLVDLENTESLLAVAFYLNCLLFVRSKRSVILAAEDFYISYLM